jgi:hypothetical protein
MRLFANLNTNELEWTLVGGGEITEIVVHRSESRELAIGVIRREQTGTPTPIDIGDGNFKAIVKKSATTAAATSDTQRFDEGAITQCLSFTKVTEDGMTLYKGYLPISGGALDKLMGVDPAPRKEQISVQCAEATAELAGAYFDVYESGNKPVRIWYSLGGSGSTPNTPVGGRLLQVFLSEGDSAAQVASNTANTMSIDGAWVASVASFGSDTVVAEDAEVGPRSNATPGTSGFSITILQAGGTGLSATDVDEVELELEISLDLDGFRQTLDRIPLIAKNNFQRDSDPSAPTASRRYSGTVSIANGVDTVAVTFPSAFASSDWKLFEDYISNTTDDPVQAMWSTTMTARSASGFTFKLNAATDSANYTYHWTCVLL